MSEQATNKTKKEEEAAYLKSCEQCTKFFTNQQAYQTHLKMKHENPERKDPSEEEQEPSEDNSEQDEERGDNTKKSSKNVPIRSRMLDIQRNELQDNIYTFLGELGEKNVEPISSRAEIINFANDQKLTGQTNYSVNKVIRTPYEEPIKCSEEIPVAEFQKSAHKQFLAKLKAEIETMETRVQEQKEHWELMDPMAPEEDTMDEFSLMDMKKFVQNYPKRKIELEYPHFSIFLLWVGRICKATAFKEFYMVLGEYIAEYYANEANRVKGEQAYSKWRNFYKSYDQKKMEASALEGLKIFDEKNAKKFIDYYVQWTDLYRVLSI